MGGYQRYEAYQNSGIEWLGEIPAHWDVKRSRFLLVTNPSKNEIRLSDDALVSFIAMESVGEYGGLDLSVQKTLDEIGSGYTYFAEQDVVVAKITPCFENGKGAISLGLINKIAFGTTELHVLRPDRNLNSLFLFYLTISYPFRKLGESEMYGAGGQKRIPERFLKDLRIALPPLEEQKSIARFLDYKTAQIDALIAKKASLLKKLAEKRSALISQAVTKGLDPRVPMKDSGVEWLGEIPAHWEVMGLKRLADVRGGVTKGRKLGDVKVLEFPYLRVANVQDGYIDTSDVATIEILPEELERYSLRKGDVLMNEGGDNDKLGRGAVWDARIAPCLHQNHVFAVRPQESNLSDWITLVTSSSYAKFYFFSRAKQSTNLASISATNIKRFPIVLPPIEERLEILKYVAAHESKTGQAFEKAASAIDRLKEYRTALITNAVTGAIDVRNVPIPNDLQEAA